MLNYIFILGAEVSRIMARAVLRGYHLFRLLLSRELDLGHRRHVVRRVAEESGRGRTSGGRSIEGMILK